MSSSDVEMQQPEKHLVSEQPKTWFHGGQLGELPADSLRECKGNQKQTAYPPGGGRILGNNHVRADKSGLSVVRSSAKSSALGGLNGNVR